MFPQLAGHEAPHVTPRIIARAVVASGGTLAPDRTTWLDAVDAHPWRSDFRPAILAVARVLALNADESRCAAPGLENVARVGELGMRRVYRVLRRLRAEGLLGWVTTGATGLRSGNWRATYVLTVPPGVDLPPDPDEKVSPRPGSPGPEESHARVEAFWADSKALRWVRRRYAPAWTDRQFWTALRYNPDTGLEYGPPTGRSLWRILAWRVRRYLAADGGFRGAVALGAIPGSSLPTSEDHEQRLADLCQWEAEMAQPGAREACDAARMRCLVIARQIGTAAREARKSPSNTPRGRTVEAWAPTHRAPSPRL